MNWLLPEYLSDALPGEAANIERLRRLILDLFKVHGYALVMPPHLEYLESLLTGSGQDLNLRTFKLVDQLSGRTLGVRADITPQVARIDAHLLNHQGTTRLCYCDSVLHTLPASIAATREPVQIGAEIYGYAGVEADLEIIRLMAQVLTEARLPAFRIDLGHVGIFRALVESESLSAEQVETLFGYLQAKDTPALQAICETFPANSPVRAIPALTGLYGGLEVLAEARQSLPALPAIEAALATLETVFAQNPELSLSIDLSDLRGYHYHNGLVFAAYCSGYPAAIALGGRYDGAGEAFGRARPATGFSADLRELARMAKPKSAAAAIVAPNVNNDPAAKAVIESLRKQGEVVVELLPGETACESPLCDRRLVKQGEQWLIEAL